MQGMRKPVLTDGAWGTALQAMGLPCGQFSAPWNMSHPQAVAAVAQGYLEAGSKIILTNTFGPCTHDEARAGAEISLRAAEGQADVFGSLGPGADDGLAAVLADAGVAGLVIETMTSLEEASHALQAARATGLSVVVSFAFGFGDVTVAEAVRRMENEGAFAIGVNCVAMEPCLEFCRQLRMATKLPIWSKPNAATAAEFAAGALLLVATGADYVGGCCGTTAEFIRAVAAALAMG
jgi:5-methyltetrahydrofolate--homocysteine methyltransferase